MRRFAPLSAAVLLVSLAACARDREAGEYPSLARRPAEAKGFGEPAAPPPAPAVADPALDGRIAAMRARLGDIANGATRDTVAAERAAAAARGRAIGSEAWLAAQSALAQLDDWRAQASALATEADALAIERAGRVDPDYPALTALREAIRSEAERQTQAIDRTAALTPSA